MDYVQINYDRTMAVGLPGSLTGLNDTRLFSFLAQQEIPFGRVISLGTWGGLPNAAILGGGTVAATAGYLQGNPTVSAIEAIQAITDGGFSVKLDGSTVATAVGPLDFSTASNFNDVATVIQTALSTNATCTYDAGLGAFKITSATTGSTSSVIDFSTNGTYTSVADELGFSGTPVAVSGTDQYVATNLGISVRSVTVEAKDNGVNSNLPVVKVGDVGCYIQDGIVRVQVKDDVVKNQAVYFDPATGEIYGGTASHTALGTSKFLQDGAAGEVVDIDVVGLR